ncbi:hypothetical protein NHQ30_007096 [Ciborinia camelliae]|nr:hypothetical protein NHQ30_007096 [Ciborinia camelliae]
MDEIDRLKEVFNTITAKVPEMADLIESLRSYCLHQNTFIEEDYKRLVGRVLENGPEITRMKLNLPFQVVENSSMTATRLFANTLACAANRPEEHKKIDTMVLDHVTDKTINNIFNVPIDVKNAFKTFENLKSLVISVKIQESRTSPRTLFSRNIWLLIRKAQDLESLCIIGWNIRRNAESRRTSLSRIPFSEWSMRSLPYHPSKGPVLNRLRCLELKRLNIDPLMLLLLIKENSHSLTELYLNEVYLKVSSLSDKENTSLWIGHANIPKPEKCTWVGPEIREIGGLNLRILRVSNIGYDDFEPDPDSANPNYDLDDPTGHNKSFDQRFVEAVVGTEAPPSLESPLSDASTEVEDTNGEPFNVRIDPDIYDAEAYQMNHKIVSYKRSIDGVFINHTEGALRTLQNLINVADRGMDLIASEIGRTNGLIVDAASGAIVSRPAGT